MSLAIVWKPRALRQAAAAQQWWSDNRPSAPLLLRNEIARATALIAEVPNSGALVHGRDARRVPLESSGYVLFYRTRPRSHRVEILALVHGSRRKLL